MGHERKKPYSSQENKAISVISAQENNAENVTEDKTVKNSSFWFVPLHPDTKPSNGRDETGRKDQKNQNNIFQKLHTKKDLRKSVFANYWILTISCEGKNHMKNKFQLNNVI